jgi:hypothetical protein
MWRHAEGIMARGRRRQREEPDVDLEESVDLEERYDECRKSPLICMATYDDDC